MIPKIIHYCWFGGGKLPKNVQQCIKSWKENLKDYEIVKWDESNSPLDSEFVKQAIYDKKWAYVSDFVRVHALSKYGGIYLDTDMLIIKHLDVFLENGSFLGFENPGVPSCGIIGAKVNHPFWEKVLNHYKNINYSFHYSENTIPKIVKSLIQNYYGQNYLNSPSSDLMLYSVDYFYPMPYFADDSPFSYITKNTYAIHLWNGSWLTLLEKAEWNFKHGHHKKGIKLALNSIKETPKNRKGYEKLISFLYQTILFELVKVNNVWKKRRRSYEDKLSSLL